ncbi:MAG: hypothetical protein SVY53_12605 [Chloroflexota bacterium]|nr:hypothetical protein [Chloroflexota bacterium]
MAVRTLVSFENPVNPFDPVKGFPLRVNGCNAIIPSINGSSLR